MAIPFDPEQLFAEPEHEPRELDEIFEQLRHFDGDLAAEARSAIERDAGANLDDNKPAIR